MMYIADTHALVWHLARDDRLGKGARRVLNEADRGDAEVVVPTIVLAEVLYLSRKADVSFDSLIDFIKDARNYSAYPLGLNVVSAMRKLAPEYSIHDAAIVATSRILDAPVITKDEVIRRLGDAKVIW
ncbi:MAG: type II toxin-antitoxin system VapC family toxin [Euryarchaeota archaeon]|nr:type II toxin-antitoxin system VapC family toxin [Euryarchaeota archaeon]